MKRWFDVMTINCDFLDKILNLPKQANESSAALRKMYDVANESMAAIKNLTVNTENWDPMIVHVLLKKLNKTTILEYEGKLTNVRELQTLPEFLEFIESRFLALLSTESVEKTNDKPFNTPFEKQLKKEVPFKCGFCEKPHSIYKCEAFKVLEPVKRSEFIREKRACFRCLQMHGKQEPCKTKYNCKLCDKPHNTLLHFELGDNNYLSFKCMCISFTCIQMHVSICKHLHASAVYVSICYHCLHTQLLTML